MAEFRYFTHADLGFDPHDVYRVGAWFLAPEDRIWKRGAESPFAPAKAAQGGNRPVVQAMPWGPNLVFFARTATGFSGFPHDRHAHRSSYPKCAISKDGRVVGSLPVNVPVSALSHDLWSCVEPESSALYEQMERWLRR